MLVKELFSSASHVKEATFTAVCGPFDANSCLCCEVFWVDWPGSALGICKECVLIERIETVKGSKSVWRSGSCWALLLAFPLKAACVGKLLEESVFVDHASIELWLGISGLECLLPLVSLILELMGDHLVVLLQLVEVLIELSLQLCQKSVVLEVFDEPLVVRNKLTSAQILLEILPGSKLVVEDASQLVMNVAICRFSYVHEIKILRDCWYFVSQGSQLRAQSTLVAVELPVDCNIEVHEGWEAVWQQFWLIILSSSLPVILCTQSLGTTCVGLMNWLIVTSSSEIWPLTITIKSKELLKVLVEGVALLVLSSL